MVADIGVYHIRAATVSPSNRATAANNLMLVMIGLFYHRPFIKTKGEMGKQSSISLLILDSLFVVAAIGGVGLYVTLNYHAIIYRQGAFTAMDAVVSVVAVVLVFDAVRRAVGWPLTIVCLVALAYALLGRLMPGALFHRGIRLIGFPCS